MNRFNFNDKVTVELTDYGLSVYRKHFKSINIEPEPIINYIFQGPLWELCNIFGHEMYNGNPNSCFANFNFKLIRH